MAGRSLRKWLGLGLGALLLAACGVNPGPPARQATAEAGLAHMLATRQAQATADAPAPTPTATPSPVPTPTATSRPIRTVVPRRVSTPAPTPPPAVIRLTTSWDTVYYAVDGRTTTEIFDSLEANGPTSGLETSERFTAGLTEADQSFEYVLSSGFLRCELESANINLSMVVTLPRHANRSGLSPDLLSRWLAFKDNVEAHEQRHVDIYNNSMEEFERGLAGDYSRRFSDCDSLTSRLTADWELQQDLVGQEQDAFHVSEEQRSKGLRGPVQIQIDQAEAELARLQDKLDRGSSTIIELRSKIDTQEQSAAVYESQMDAIQSSYPDLVLPPDVFDTFEGLRAQWSTHNDLRNEFVGELNEAVRSNNETVEEFNGLIDDIAELREKLAWLP